MDQTEKPKAKTSIKGQGLNQIPLCALLRIGEIFHEGEQVYGRDNWKNGVGDKEWQEKRWNNAERHLRLWNEGDRSVDHLAKVAWFCLTMMWIEERQIREGKSGPDPFTELIKTSRGMA